VDGKSEEEPEADWVFGYGQTAKLIEIPIVGKTEGKTEANHQKWIDEIVCKKYTETFVIVTEGRKLFIAWE
jgi:hypothetical protein